MLFPVLYFIRSAYVCLLRLCDDVVIASYKLLWIVNFDGLYRRLTAGPTSATSEQTTLPCRRHHRRRQLQMCRKLPLTLLSLFNVCVERYVLYILAHYHNSVNGAHTTNGLYGKSILEHSTRICQLRLLADCALEGQTHNT